MSKDEEKNILENNNDTFVPSARSGSSGSKTSTSKSTAGNNTVKRMTTTGSYSNTNLKVSTVAREKYKEKRRKKAARRKGFLGVISFILSWIIKIVIFVALAGAGLFFGLWLSVTHGAGALTKETFEINNFTTYVYDIYGNEYTQLTGAENRDYASIDDISPYLPEAFIAIEDERFMQHHGVDLKRTGGATIKYILSKFGIGEAEYGGSTITQQVIKKATGEDDHSSLRKAKEIIRAFQLENWLTKSEIIELYMNLIYLGEGAYGVEKASYTYFGKSAKELSIAQCALIAGLAQAPEGYNPYNFPEKAKKRQELVLGKMLELEKITQEQYDEAMAEELVYERGNISLASSNSYFVDAVVEALIKDLMEDRNINRQMAQALVYNGGLKIYTTLDPNIQEILETTYKDEKYFKTRKGYDENLQSAMVIIDYKEGNVVGLIGGAGEKTTLRGLNRATGMTRSIGSNMKPIGVYGPGLELGTVTSATTYNDIPTTYRVNGSAWSIKNYDGRYRGLINVRKAIEVSDNVVAAKCMMESVGTEYSYSFLEKLGITSLTSADKKSPASLSLGGMNKGISPLELAGAYGTIANKGVYIEPKLYTKVTDRNGNIVFKKQSKIRDVMSVENAYILTDMLHTVVVGSEGTGSAAKLNGIDVAAKTGTTSDDKDRWFTAFTPYYVGSVWFGYDTPEYINVSTNPGAKVWHDVMAEVHKGKPNATFEKPAGVVNVTVCRDSGLLATDACRADKRGNREITCIFNNKNGTIPKTKCNVHEWVEVCPETFEKPNPVCIQKVGTIKISRINRHYQKTPSYKTADYAYETPSVYCTLPEHYCPTDLNGNFIAPNSATTARQNAIEDEVNKINENINSIENNSTNTTNNAPTIIIPSSSTSSSSTTTSPSSSTSTSSNTDSGKTTTSSSSSSSKINSSSSSSSSNKKDDSDSGRTTLYWWER